MQSRTILTGTAIAVVASLGVILPANARLVEGQLLAQSSAPPSGNPSTMEDPNRPDATSDPSQLDVPRDQRDAPPSADTEVNNQQPNFGTPTSQDPNRPDATSDPSQLDVPRDQRDAPPTSETEAGTQDGSTIRQGSTTQQGTTGTTQQGTTGTTTQQRTTTQQNFETQPSTGTSGAGYSTNEPVRGLW
ncbi:hypothetical protein [Oscillatoria sp. FACHB-1407]